MVELMAIKMIATMMYNDCTVYVFDVRKEGGGGRGGGGRGGGGASHHASKTRAPHNVGNENNVGLVLLCSMGPLCRTMFSPATNKNMENTNAQSLIIFSYLWF